MAIRLFKVMCDDYNQGPFELESYDPKLKWTITKSYFVEHPNPDGLAKLIIIKANVTPTKVLTVRSHPYSFGKFTADGFDWGFGGKYNWLDTNDPEEAIYIAEHMLFEWADTRRYHYEQIAEKLNPY